MICFALFWALMPWFRFAFGSQEFVVRPIDIPPRSDLYEYWLVASESQTMSVIRDTTEVLIWDKNSRRLMKRGEDTEHQCGAPEDFRIPKFTPINTGDGRHRRIYTLNGTMPGPTFVVYEGSQVKIHVTSELVEGLIIHFHGLRQERNFWRDGGGTLSQCPIQEDETITYSFLAEEPGTFFYHGHHSSRGDGLEGALIILPRKDSQMVHSTEGLVIPDAQYVGFVQDWYPNVWSHEYSFVKWRTNKFYYGYDNFERCYAETKTYDGSRLGQIPFHSALVNGRGWYNVEDLLFRPFDLPLENFDIQPGGIIAIRFINAGILFPFVISIDDHVMEIVSSDGNDVVPVRAHYLNIYPGERYVAVVRGLLAPRKRKFFIKFQSLEAYTEDFEALPRNHFTLAYLRYTSKKIPHVPEKPEGLLFGSSKKAKVPHRMVNCPFKSFPKEFNIECLNAHEMESLTLAKPDLLGSQSNVQRIFLNVYNDMMLNGLRFAYPKAPPALFQDNDAVVLKSCDLCRRSQPGIPCRCTQFVNITLDSTVQLVFYNREKFLLDPRDLDAFAHPMHIHGTQFHVVATGYPEYDEDGIISKFNADIKCHDRACNKAVFAKEPSLNLQNPALKDTVAVPVGGYVVVQFNATNPGWWPLHCHMLPHHMDGMALAVKVGEYSDMPPKPADIPTCFTAH